MSLILKSQVFASWIPDGKIFFKPSVFATVIPSEDSDIEVINGDTSRIIQNTQSISCDTLRRFNNSPTQISGDTLRIINQQGVSEVIGDTLRKISNTQFVSGDTLRVIKSDIFSLQRSIELEFSNATVEGGSWTEFFEDISTDCTDEQVSAFALVCADMVEGELKNIGLVDIKTVEVAQ